MSARVSLSTLAVLVGNRLPAALGRDLKPDHAGQAGRRNHTAQTLTQLAEWTPEACELPLAELGAAYDVLGAYRSKDAAERARQLTSKQLAELCRQSDGEPPLSGISQALSRAIVVWEAWAKRCDMSDPRQCSMHTTFKREANALRAELLAVRL